jgi:5-methylcytosine-specific restriction endonuclease McrBC regulatory subunit McrC
LACEFDELSENNLFNQILKTTVHYLLIDDGVNAERKAELKKLLVFFDGIDLLEPSGIHWSRLNYQRNNRNYEMLMNVCYFVLDGMLQTTENGEYKMAAFSDEHMARLYEKFILEYYHQHHTYLSEVKAGQVKWNLTGENSESMIRFLPVMQTDTMLRYKEKVLIIDAKYYGRTLKKQFDKYSLHSNNVYQMDSSLNTSKSNRLPKWDPFFKRFAGNQFVMYKLVQKYPEIHKKYESCYRDNLHSIWAGQELYRPGNTKADFFNILEKNMQPVYDSARRQGYELWNYDII